MARNYFTSKAAAQKTMKENSYAKVSSCSDDEYSVALYVNTLTGASAVLKVYKHNANKECDTFVEIFENKDEGKSFFEAMKNWMK